MWKRFVELDRPQMTIWREGFARWILKATHTHTHTHTHTLRICNTFCCSTAKWLHGRPSILRCTYFACLVLSFSPLKHMPEWYLQIGNKGLSMSEDAVLFLLRMLSCGMWGPVFWCINAVVQEQCPTPIFMESLCPEAGGCAFRIHICTYQITRVNVIEDIHLQCKFPFRYVLLYHSMLRDRIFLRRRYMNQMN